MPHDRLMPVTVPPLKIAEGTDVAVEEQVFNLFRKAADMMLSEPNGEELLAWFAELSLKRQNAILDRVAALWDEAEQAE
jgi:hypothetical protein